MCDEIVIYSVLGYLCIKYVLSFDWYELDPLADNLD